MIPALTIAAVALLVAFVVDHVRIERSLRPRPRPPARDDDAWPSLTVIRPIRGLDTGAEENLRAALENGYPGPVETLFVFDDAAEPAVPLARAAIDRHAAAGGPGTARVVFCGAPAPGMTGKLNAMIAGLREAEGELIGFADSDIRPAPEALRVVVAALLADEGAGAAFAPVVVTEPPTTVGDVGYALLLNGLYGPSVEATVQRSGGRLPFIMGQFMVLRREAIRRIGGLRTAMGQLVDDMYLGARIHEEGLANVVAPVQVPVIQRGLSWSGFVGLFVRWITFSRTGLSGRSVRVENMLRAAAFWVGLLGAIGAAIAGAWLPAAVLLLTPLAATVSLNRLHERFGGAPIPPRFHGVAFALLLSAPVIFAMSIGSRQVSWRGRVYALDDDASLDEENDEGAAAESKSRV